MWCNAPMLEPDNIPVMFHECMVFCCLDMPGVLRDS